MRFFLQLFLSILTFSQILFAQWTLQNPINPFPVSDMYFKNEQNILLLNFNHLYRTFDGGESWNEIQLPYATHNNCIAFYDTSLGLIGGESGHVFKTNDGGFNWIDLSISLSSSFNEMIFLDSNTIIALGRDIYKSVDGALSWNITYDITSSYVFGGMDFFDENNGLAVGPDSTILKTTNGGENWFAQSSGLSSILRDVDCIDSTTAIVIASNGKTLRTTDKGSTWTIISSGSAKNLSDVNFISNEIGFIAGGGSEVATIQGFILKTTNGGLTWNYSLNENEIIPYSIYSYDGNTLFAAGDWSILKSSDGGANWLQYYYYQFRLNKISFLTDEIGIAVGSQGTILRTTDAGNKWVPTLSGTSKQILNLTFSDAQNGYAVGETGLFLQTTDAGVNWTSRNISYLNLRGVDFFDNIVGLIVGDSGLVLRTSDGGISWNKQTTPTIYPLYNVTFVTNNIAVASGVAGTILKSTDAGISWLKQQSGTTNRNFYDVSFINENNGVIVGNGGSVYKTTNGGTDWTSINTGINKIFYDVNFISTDIVYISSSAKGFSVSYDGGLNWNHQEITVSYDIGNLYGLHFVNSKKGYTVGDKGIILLADFTNVSVNPELEIISNYSLAQNYPNPFNPSTTINYSLPEKSKVVLKVYDILGNEVSTLVNEDKESGRYEVKWNTSGLSSGIYFYKIQANDFISTKKMVLLK